MTDQRTDDELSRIRERAESVRDAEVERACARLRARGELDPADRTAVEQLADRLVERLLAVPARGLAATDEREDVAESVRRLFDG